MTTPTSPNAPSPPGLRPYWLVIPFLFLFLGCNSSTPVSAPSAVSETETGTVRLEINWPDDSEKQVVEIDDVADGSTLESVMKQLEDPNVEISGSGTTAFVQTIGETSTGAADGWTFKVDGEFANQGIGLTELHPPTTVSWSFGTPEEF